MRKAARIIYIVVILILAISTYLAVWNGGYHIATGLYIGLAVISAATSMLPFFVSMHFFKKAEDNREQASQFNLLGLLFYPFCFPVKLWVIYSNVDLLINGGPDWAFG